MNCTPKQSGINIDELKRHLKDTGQTFSLMLRIGGIAEGKGIDHSQPCPHCEGNNRFWYSREYERCYCRKCKPNGEGFDIFALVQHHRSIGFKEAVELIALESEFETLHVRHAVNEVKKAVQENKPILCLDTFHLDPDSPIYKTTAAHRPDITFDDYKLAEAKLFRDGIAIPMFDHAGVLSGHVRYFQTGGKPKLIGKSGIVGQDAIYNLRVAKQAKIIFKTAGVSDYLVLSGIIARLGLEADYYCFTNGAGENELPDKFEPLLKPALAGLSVGVIQDNDEVGEKGALRWGESIAEYAADVRIIKLPPVIFDCPVKDLRDFFAINGTTFTDLVFSNSAKGGSNGIH
jgi:hypothetical protein